jgi:hypothetical protein
MQITKNENLYFTCTVLLQSGYNCKKTWFLLFPEWPLVFEVTIGYCTVTLYNMDNSDHILPTQ